MRSLFIRCALGLVGMVAGCSGETSDAAPYECSLEAPEWGHGGELMLPGTDCISCHQEGGSAADSPFTVAGTVFMTDDCPEPVQGAVVHLVDADGVARDLSANEVGNFFTSEPLAMPLEVSVEYQGVVVDKPRPLNAGSCNMCHQPGGVGYVRPGLPTE
jgi:hypothetical protein